MTGEQETWQEREARQAKEYQASKRFWQVVGVLVGIAVVWCVLFNNDGPHGPADGSDSCGFSTSDC